MPVSKLVGARVKRREDPKLIRGLGQFVDDVNLPDTLHVAILRTPYAHAKIKSLETGGGPPTSRRRRRRHGRRNHRPDRHAAR